MQQHPPQEHQWYCTHARAGYGSVESCSASSALWWRWESDEMNPALFQQSLYGVIPSHIQVIFAEFSCLCPATIVLSHHLLQALTQRSAHPLTQVSMQTSKHVHLVKQIGSNPCNNAWQSCNNIPCSNAASDTIAEHTLMGMIWLYYATSCNLSFRHLPFSQVFVKHLSKAKHVLMRNHSR